MFSISLEKVIEKAREARACKEELDIIKSLDSIENVLSHKRAAYWLYWYTLEVIRGRWSEAEEYIMKDPKWAYYYANYIIKNRWPEAEKYIIEDLEWAYWYTRDVIKDR